MSDGLDELTDWITTLSINQTAGDTQRAISQFRAQILNRLLGIVDSSLPSIRSICGQTSDSLDLGTGAGQEGRIFTVILLLQSSLSGGFLHNSVMPYSCLANIDDLGGHLICLWQHSLCSRGGIDQLGCQLCPPSIRHFAHDQTVSGHTSLTTKRYPVMSNGLDDFVTYRQVRNCFYCTKHVLIHTKSGSVINKELIEEIDKLFQMPDLKEITTRVTRTKPYTPAALIKLVHSIVRKTPVFKKPNISDLCWPKEPYQIPPTILHDKKTLLFSISRLSDSKQTTSRLVGT